MSPTAGGGGRRGWPRITRCAAQRRRSGGRRSTPGGSPSTTLPPGSGWPSRPPSPPTSNGRSRCCATTESSLPLPHLLVPEGDPELAAGRDGVALHGDGLGLGDHVGERDGDHLRRLERHHHVALPLGD